MAINTRLIGNLGSGGGQLHQALNTRSVTIGEPGKHYIVQISGYSPQSRAESISYNGDTVGYSDRQSTAILDGGGVLSSKSNFTALWQEIDGYTNH